MDFVNFAQNVIFEDIESVKAVVAPVMQYFGLPANLTFKFCEDFHLWMQINDTLVMQPEVIYQKLVPHIKKITDCKCEQDFVAHCQGLVPPRTPMEFLQEKAKEKMSQLAGDMTQVKILLCAAQFLNCMKTMRGLDQNQQCIGMIQRNLDRFGRTRMRTITEFLKSPEAALYFGRDPGEGMPTSRAAPSIEFLDEAKQELDEIVKDIEKAMGVAASARWQMVTSALLSGAKIAHAFWTEKHNAPIGLAKQVLFGTGVVCEAVTSTVSIHLAYEAHVQLHELRRLAAIAQRLAYEVEDAKEFRTAGVADAPRSAGENAVAGPPTHLPQEPPTTPSPSTPDGDKKAHFDDATHLLEHTKTIGSFCLARGRLGVVGKLIGRAVATPALGHAGPRSAERSDGSGKPGPAPPSDEAEPATTPAIEYLPGFRLREEMNPSDAPAAIVGVMPGFGMSEAVQPQQEGVEAAEGRQSGRNTQKRQNVADAQPQPKRQRAARASP